MASEVEDMLTSIDWDAVPEIDIILIAVAMRALCLWRFDTALAASDAILAQPHEEPTIEFAGAHTFRGVIDMCEATPRSGRRQLRDGIRHARMLPPVGYAIISVLLGLMAAMGMYRPDDLVMRCARHCGAPSRSVTSAASSPRSSATAQCYYAHTLITR